MDYKGYQIRPGTMDDYVVNELRTYRHLPLVEDDRVLDVGANIGVFTKYAVQQGALVLAIEPDPDNFALLEKNAGNAMLCRAAVVRSAKPEVTLYINKGKNKGLHSTIPTRGRDEITVPAVNWNNILTSFQPTKIKIDCEGAEYDWLAPKELPACVEGVILEYNLTRKYERAAAARVHQEFVDAGFTCTRSPTLDTRAWATLACYIRNT
jgi:FkbM family methyltransferase